MTIEIFSDTFQVENVEFGIELTADQHGLTACRLETDYMTASAGSPSNPHLAQAAEQLRAYFAGELTRFSVKLAPDGTAFQQLVWHATTKIPSGQVRSYGWVAREVGNIKAVRAVAQALGANPLLLFVPCHRVIRSNGDIGGFSCGLEWKILLHSHEGITSPSLL